MGFVSELGLPDRRVDTWELIATFDQNIWNATYPLPRFRIEKPA